MIIPSIDIMDGKAVQLRRGKELILTDERDPIALAREFNRYGEVAVIDLDAALGKGDNLPLIKDICRVADVRAGGGIRTVERGQALLRAGAKQLIIGTSAEPEFLRQFPQERLMVALDHENGNIVDQGWTRPTTESLMDRALRLTPFCGSFLCTFVETEGTLSGMDVVQLQQLQAQIQRPLTVAGGVATSREAAEISRIGLDVQVGMALYTGQLNLCDALVESLDFEKCPQMPTIVQDEAGQVLMLAYSSRNSLKYALQEGRGIYFSRSRNEIWRKGETSGHYQTLLRCRADCDQDALLFTVRQNRQTCHSGAYSCFGGNAAASDFSLPNLMETLKKRQASLPPDSYSAQLFQDRELLLRKIMEEAFEVTRATNREELTWEIADSLYFLSVLAVANDIRWQDIEAELGGRRK